MGFLSQSQKAGLLLKPRRSTPSPPLYPPRNTMSARLALKHLLEGSYMPQDLVSAVVKPCFGMRTHAHSFGPGIEIRPSDLGLGNYSGPLFLALLPAVGCETSLPFQVARHIAAECLE